MFQAEFQKRGISEMRNKTGTRLRNEEIWRQHVAALARHPGSVSSYCETHGLSRFALKYWRRKLEGHSEAIARRATSSPAFIPVVVSPREKRSEGQLPDPKWLAELLHHLSARAGGDR
jgi:hypothetical protein